MILPDEDFGTQLQHMVFGDPSFFTTYKKAATDKYTFFPSIILHLSYHSFNTAKAKFVPVPSDCITENAEYNMAYTGDSVGEENVYNVEECVSFCRSLGAKYFSWHMYPLGTCICRKAYKGREEARRVTSGNSFCGEWKVIQRETNSLQMTKYKQQGKENEV